MPARSRKFSEADLVEPRSKSSFSSLFAHIQDITPAPKRQRTGLNSRFDRMMDTVNVTYRSPAGRNRTRSAGSSSNSSYIMPTTPLDAYDTLQSGRLGKDFAVIKMKQGTVFHREEEDISRIYQENPSNHRSTETLPSWLSEAFLSLDETHPLRLLLPSSMDQSSVVMSSVLADPNRDLRYHSEEESPFAFSALEADGMERHATALSYSDGSNALPKSSQVNDLHSLSFIPFTRPGPASHVSLPSPFVPRVLTLSPPPPPQQHPNPSCHDAARPRSYHSPDPSSRSQLFETDSLDQPLPAELRDNFTINCHNPQPTPAMVPPPRHAHFGNVPRSASQHSHNCLASPYSQHILTPCSDIPITDYSSDEVQQDEAPVPHVCLPRREGIDMSRFQNIFSTPGPGYLVSRPVYFDSPAESSSSSDPALEIKYDIECAELDFQWKPYDRSRTSEPQTVCVPSDSSADHLSDDGPEVGVTEGLGQHTPAGGCADNANKLTWTSSYPQTSTPRRYDSSPGPFRFTLPPEAHQMLRPLPTSPPATTEDERQILSKEDHLPVFAPAPGIYLSPLQCSRSSSVSVTSVEDKKLSLIEKLDKLSSKTSNENPTANIDESGDVLGSQSSTDSIESWG
ncbi:hypothetical protein ARMSODRAFT_1001274 [Armillaria solidipes]|uniref:Uncharacterized protein n=1 Tax=Armillaria solidipes TaxID=1076256 RepID=A0A2H3CE38_9AGAR|nr:hypothetical protein ARMSODRAFT_1001274 [Armillaria solidipes]